MFQGDVPSASEHTTLSKQLAKLSPIVQLMNQIETKDKVRNLVFLNKSGHCHYSIFYYMPVHVYTVLSLSIGCQLDFWPAMNQ